ncbi:MAG: hypothetical protein WBD09_02200 [Halobacteriota archaeon]
MQKNGGDFTQGEGKKKELKQIKISAKCHTALTISKARGESYEMLLWRLMSSPTPEVPEGESKAINSEYGEKENKINDFLNQFGLTGRDIGSLAKQYVKNENLRLKGYKPIDKLKAFTLILWFIIAVLCLPYIFALLREVI